MLRFDLDKEYEARWGKSNAELLDEALAMKARDDYFRAIGQEKLWTFDGSAYLLFLEYMDWVDTKCAE